VSFIIIFALVGAIPFFEITIVKIPPEWAEILGAVIDKLTMRVAIINTIARPSCIFLKMRYSINKR
jgi:hypothetical protein